MTVKITIEKLGSELIHRDRIRAIAIKQLTQLRKEYHKKN